MLTTSTLFKRPWLAERANSDETDSSKSAEKVQDEAETYGSAADSIGDRPEEVEGMP